MAVARTSSDNLWSKLSCARSTPMIALRFQFAKTRFQKWNIRMVDNQESNSRVQFKILDLANLVLLKEFLREGAYKAEASLPGKKTYYLTSDFFGLSKPSLLQLRKTPPWANIILNQLWVFIYLLQSPLSDLIRHDYCTIDRKLKAKTAIEAVSWDQKLQESRHHSKSLGEKCTSTAEGRRSLDVDLQGCHFRNGI